MKKKLLLGFFAMVLSATALFAQDGPAMKQPNERTKEMLLQMQTEVGITGEQAGKLNEPIFTYFDARQKAIQEMRASGTMDRAAMKAKNDELLAARNAKIAMILSTEQMDKLKAMEEKNRSERRSNGN